MITVNESVIEKIVFDKVADYELPNNTSEWDEEILDQFFEQINYLPKEFGVDVIVKSVDENEGYAKGSIVVWYQGKQINFPVIVNNFQLSPFDVFIHKAGGEVKYETANLRNIKKALTSEELGVPKRKYPRGTFEAIKPVGGIYPKTPVNIGENPDLNGAYPNFSKMSSWPITAHKDDIEKLAIQMEADKNVGKNFVDNTGDLIGNIIELNRHNRIVGDDHKEGILDTYKIVKAKQAITVLDSQFIDVNKLQPMVAPSVCELRMYEYPTMEDFIESGTNMAGRFLATTTGKPIAGIILDMTDSYDLKNRYGCPEPTTCCEESDGIKEKKRQRERRDQIFISLDGKYYCKHNDYDRTGIGFYGMKVLKQEDAVQKAVQLLSKHVTDDFINLDTENRSDGADKSFNLRLKPMEQGKDGEYGGDVCCGSSYGNRMYVIYGAGDAFECLTFGSRFRKYKVNNSHVYVSRDEAIIPANVAGVQMVKNVEDPVYKMVIGKVKKIFLIPEGALIFNASMMQDLSQSDFLKPAKSIRQAYEEANINKVAMIVKSGGYVISGKPFEPLKKVAHLNGGPLSTDQTFKALGMMGMNKDSAARAMKTALAKYASENVSDKSVTIYGVNDDYINVDVVNQIEKRARIKQIIRDECLKMRIDLTKEASVLDDPEAVDVVLSLNFINEDNLSGYVENVREMKKVAGDLAELLVASRMGLKTVEEGAVKKAMDGLNTVIGNLEEIKMATVE